MSENSDIESKIIDLYTSQNKSTYEIAQDLNTYPNKIRRILLKHGYELKDKSTAQKEALKAGRSKHPTLGKQRSQEEKLLISKSLVAYWEGINEKQREIKISKAKEKWKNMSESQRSEMQKKAIMAIRVAAKEGSKLEKFIQTNIENAGYQVRKHEMISPAESLEIDLYVPELKTIIEVDGPSHFLPIWGEEKLQKQINADLRKSGLLLSKGYVVIRVVTQGQESLSKQSEIIKKILGCLDDIKYKFPKEKDRFIEIQ